VPRGNVQTADNVMRILVSRKV